MNRVFRTPSAVVWDLGNVLIEWDPYRAIAAGVGIEETERLKYATDFEFHAWNRNLDAGVSWDTALNMVKENHPQWLPHVTAYRDHTGLALVGEIPGTVEILHDLHAAGVPQYAVTNWSADHWPPPPEVFRHLEIFTDIVVSGIVGVMKPDPAIFRLLCARNSLATEDLIFIDDRHDNVGAAREMGIEALRYENPESLRSDLRNTGLPV